MSVVRRGSVGRIVVGLHSTTCTSGIVTIRIGKQVEVQYDIWQGYSRSIAAVLLTRYDRNRTIMTNQIFKYRSNIVETNIRILTEILKTQIRKYLDRKY